MSDIEKAILSDYFTKVWGYVQTPFGEISMGELMRCYLSEEEQLAYWVTLKENNELNKVFNSNSNIK